MPKPDSRKNPKNAKKSAPKKANAEAAADGLVIKIPKPPRPRYEVEGRDLGEHGEGIGRLADGLTVFVPDLLPGEKAMVTLQKSTPRYAQGRLAERIATSPDRVAPACDLFGACGGCQLMHMSAAAQAAWKAQSVAEAFRRLAKMEVAVEPILTPSPALGYRNRLLLPVQGNSREPLIGFFKTHSHDIVPLESCPVAAMKHREIVAELRRWIGLQKVPIYVEEKRVGLLRHAALRASSTGDLHLTLVTTAFDPRIVSAASHFFDGLGRGRFGLTGLSAHVHAEPGNAVFGGENKTMAGRGFVEEKLGGLVFEIAPDAFFQLNLAGAEAIFDKAVEALPSGARRFADLFCGTGALSLLAAARRPGLAVTGVERGETAVASARHNAQKNRLHADFHVADAAAWWHEHGGGFDAVAVNPPRTGLAPDLADALAEKGPERLVYISCKPATLARDAARLAAGGYKVTSLQPVDLLPQTVHVETIAVFDR